ncbi:MAG: ribonuclease Z [Clostridia bacterium]|nr:ribonuclease Z [Clostridia bacterium]
MIDITLLGTSSMMPLPERALTSVFLSCDGHSILFDCGEGTQTAARKAGVSLMKTDMIALTHYHGDHIFGLPGLLQTMHSMGRAEPLYITGPEGLTDALRPLLTLAGTLAFEIITVLIPDGGLELDTVLKGFKHGAKLAVFKTEHRVASRGYVFTLSRPGRFMPEKAQALGVPETQFKLLQRGQSVEVDGKTVFPGQVLGAPRKGLKFVFSGDTAYCDTLTEAAKDADLAVFDATYAEDEQADIAYEHGHMNFRLAAEAASKANVKQLWLAHYSQMIKDPLEYIENAKKVFENTVCGCDGMKETLLFEE